MLDAKLNRPPVPDSEDHSIDVSFLGKATRRRDIPTKAQMNKEKKRKSNADTEKDKSEADQLGLSVKKSRWSTSKCAQCEEGIEIGDQIARPADFKERGGWSHLECALKNAVKHANPSVKRRLRI